jgi:hypothetical protein
MPDEFPLNVFYEALRRKLTAVVESARGITGTAATATSASPTSATGPRATAAVVSATSARVTA